MIPPRLKRWTTATLGTRGERAAARYLSRHGLRILGRNLETTAGEADLLCEDRSSGTVVLVEVKSRRRKDSSRNRDEPERQITPAKRQRLLGIARALRRANDWHNRPMRIDVIAIDFCPGTRRPVIRHHINAIPDQR